ncbi:MAG: hypothetical protein O7C39_00275 [Bacteroidetes bacterium]|nr:hypothetical protein [Bacteroidota bacterium]
MNDPKRPPRKTAEEQAAERQDRIKAEANEYRQLLVDEPRFKFGKKSTEKVAREMGKILEEVKRDHRLSREKIARAIWRKKGQPNKKGQPRRFYKIAIVPNKPPKDAQLKTLTTSAKLYEDFSYRIAKLAYKSSAKLASEFSDELLVRLFRGTEIESEVSVRRSKARTDVPNDETRMKEAITTISDGLELMSNFVSRETNLPEHAKRMLRLRAGTDYDVLQERLEPGGRSFLHHEALAKNYEVREEIPPIPSVPLFRELRVGPFQTTLAVASEPVEPSIFDQSCQNSDHAAWTSREVTVYAWREVRLAIGPGSALDAVEPMIEIRTQFELRDGDEVIPIYNAWQYGSGEAYFGLWCDDRLHPAVASLNDPNGTTEPYDNWIPLELDPIVAVKFGEDLPQGTAVDIIKDGEDDGGNDTRLFLQPEHIYATWMPATEAYIEFIFASVITAPSKPEAHFEAGDNIWLLEPEVEKPLLSHPYSLAAKLEANLLDGTLERALLVEATKKVAMLDTFELETLSAARGAHAEAHARWGVSESREDDEEQPAQRLGALAK